MPHTSWYLCCKARKEGQRQGKFGGEKENKREKEREREPILEYGNTKLGKPKRYERKNRKRKRCGTKRYCDRREAFRFSGQGPPPETDISLSIHITPPPPPTVLSDGYLFLIPHPFYLWKRTCIASYGKPFTYLFLHAPNHHISLGSLLGSRGEMNAGHWLVTYVSCTVSIIASTTEGSDSYVPPHC